MTGLFFFDWTAESASDLMVAPELAATLARLEIRVGPGCPTFVEESRNGSTRRSINVSLYPLAEWIVFNWWTLLYSGRSGRVFPIESSHRSNPRRNNMGAAGDGFIWPDLSIFAESGFIRFVWAADAAPLPGRSARFLSGGSELVDFDVVRESFTDLVEAVLTRLNEAGVAETALHKEWTALAEVRADEAEFCQLSGRLGLDPFSEGVDLAASIEHIYEGMPRSIVLDFFDAANPQRLLENAEWVLRADAKTRRRSVSGQTDAPKAFDSRPLDGSRATDPMSFIGQDVHGTIRAVERFQNDGRRPFEIGYEQARLLRTEIGLSPEERFPIESMPISVSTLRSNEPSLQGLSRVFDGRTNLILGWSARREGQRFASTRALWHSLFGDPKAPFLLTAATSPSQQTARAFAAELLAPAEGIRARLGAGIGGVGVAPSIADEYAVSETVIERQMENQIYRHGV
jgi:hypothetical protein